jgi:redox-sensitive bicupin YhaK (pirin superfamily)
MGRISGFSTIIIMWRMYALRWLRCFQYLAPRVFGIISDKTRINSVNTAEKFIKGFPWHLYRGFETISYMLNGTVEHGDSLKNSGVIGFGDVQWMKLVQIHPVDLY